MRMMNRSKLSAVVLLALLSTAASCPPRTPVEHVADYGKKIAATAEDAQKLVIASAIPNDAKAKAMVVFNRLGEEITRVGKALIVIDAVTSTPEARSEATKQVTGGIAVMRGLLRSGLLPIAENDAVVGQVLKLFDNIDALFVQLETSLASLRENQS